MKKQNTQINLEQANTLFEEAKQLSSEAKYKQSNELLKKASDIYTKNSAWELYLKANIQIGENDRCLGYYDKALEHLQKILELGKKYLEEKNLVLGEILTALSMCFYEKGQYKKAISLLEASTKNYQKIDKDHIEIAVNTNNISNCYFQMGDYEIAIKNYKQVLKICKKKLGEEHPYVAIALNNLGVNYSLKGAFDKSINYYKQALQIRKKVLGNEHLEVGGTYFNLGVVYKDKGDFDLALNYLEEAFYIWAKKLGKEHLRIAANLNEQAVVYRKLNKSKLAIDLLKKVLVIRKKYLGEEHTAVAITINNLGNCYVSLKEYETALKLHQKAFEIRLKCFGKKHPYIAMSLHNLACVYFSLKNYDKTIKYSEQSLAIRYKTLEHTHSDIARDLANIGRCFFAQKKYLNAISYFQQALQVIFPKLNKELIYQNPNIETYRESYLLLQLLELKGLAFLDYYTAQSQHIKDLQAALSSFCLLNDLITKTRQSYKTEGAKHTLADKTTDIYNNSIQLIFKVINKYSELKKISQHAEFNNIPYTLEDAQKLAFSFSEYSKAILLLSNLQENDAKLAANIPAELLEKEKQLKIELNYLDKCIAKQEAQKKKKDDDLLLKFQSQYFDFKQQYDQIIEHFETAYPDYFQLKYNTQIADIQDIQQHLPEDGLMISYFIGKENYYIFAISEFDFEVMELKKPADFEEKITLFTQAIDRHNKKDFIDLSHEIYELLIAPIDYLILDAFEEIAHKPLIIIPHDILNYVPFEALIYEKANENTAYDELSFLLKQCVISYHYSATLWLHGIEKALVKEQLPNSFVGFAPVYENETKDTQIEEALNISAANMRSWASRSAAFENESWKALPYSKTEIGNVQQLFEKKGHKTNTFLYEKANKNNFIETAAKAKFLLVAAHGLVNDEQPDLGGLVFFPTQKTIQNLVVKGGKNKENESRNIDAETAKKAINNDSILSMKEAYLLNLKADLVVLSACESGIGKLAKGEGMMAINRGFLHSGASNVIFTLFKVYDKPSSELIRLLFIEILSGKSYAQALQAAKLAFLKQKMADPKLWTSYILIGY